MRSNSFDQRRQGLLALLKLKIEEASWHEASVLCDRLRELGCEERGVLPWMQSTSYLSYVGYAYSRAATKS